MKQKVSFKEINKLAIPAIIAGVAEPFISLTDIAIIGNVKEHSVEALAAAGLVGSFLSAIIWIVAQTKTAISAIVSRHFGANRLHAVKTLIPQVLFFNFILSLIIYITTAWFANAIFSAYNAENLILNYAEDYYQIRALGYPLILVTFALFGVFRGFQNTMWAMKCSITGAIVNIVLDYLLVYGVDGVIPPLHLKGAAIASVVAQFAMLMMALYFFFKKTPFNLKLRFKPNPNLKELIVMCLNLFVRTISLHFAMYLANSYATDYGKNHIAAFSITMNLWMFFTFLIDGYANAANAISGRLLGAKDYRNLRLLSIDASKYSVVVSLIVILICTIFYNKIGLIFNKDEMVLLLFSSTFWIVLLMQPIGAIAFVFDGLFKGLGEAKSLRNVLLASTFLGFWPALVLCDYFELKLYGIWIAFTVWMIVRSSVLVIKFRKKYLNAI